MEYATDKFFRLMKEMRKELNEFDVDDSTPFPDIMTRFAQITPGKEEYQMFVKNYKNKINEVAEFSKQCKIASGSSWRRTFETRKNEKGNYVTEEFFTFREELIPLQSEYQSYVARLAILTTLFINLRKAGKVWRGIVLNGEKNV